MSSGDTVAAGRSGGVSLLIDGRVESLPAVLKEVRRTLGLWRMTDRLDDALLVVDELVVNASRHVGGDLVIGLIPLPSGFRVEVADQDPDFRRHGPSPSSERFGLRIVDSACDEWGISPVAEQSFGKVVWAEFRSRPPAQGDGAEPLA